MTKSLHPKATDTLVVDNALYALTFQNGRLGYMRETHFVPVIPGQLHRCDKDLAGSPTWIVIGPSKHRPKVNEVYVEPLSVYEVLLSYEKSPTHTCRVSAKDEKTARNKAIRGYAAKYNIPFARAFDYFNKHSQTIKVTKI